MAARYRDPYCVIYENIVRCAVASYTGVQCNLTRAVHNAFVCNARKISVNIHTSGPMVSGTHLRW